METIITRQVKASKIEKLFKADSNIRNYSALMSEGEKYDINNIYTYEIKLRHQEDINPNVAFDEAILEMFPVKTKKVTNKRIFLISTELGRVRKRVSFYIAEINSNTGLRLINNTFTCNIGSNKGLVDEAIQVLVNEKELPPEALTLAGYRNYDLQTYEVLFIEGKSISYVTYR